MRRILLLISTWVLTSAQECGPVIPSCRDDYNSPVVDNPCWLVHLNGDEKEYCHKGKNLTIKTSDKDKVVNVYCDAQIIDCSSLPTLDFAKGGQLRELRFYNCGLNESISCVLRALNAKGLTGLSLFYWETEITTETLRGLDGLERFMVFDSAAITRIPTEAFKQLPALQQIRMSSNSISTIPADAFSDLTDLNITYLEISRAKLTEIQSGAFKGLRGLMDLSLFKNDIRIIDKDAFKGLPLLDTLVLQNNPIEDLPSGVFTDNPNLKVLDMRQNRASMTLRTGTLTGLTKLEKLEITMYSQKDHLSLENLSLSGLLSLKSCDLSEAGLQELPQDLFKGTRALEELKLDDNELRLLPDHVFEDLVNLKVLSLSKNKLQDQIANTSSIYEGPFSTTGKLEKLNLARNGLQSISEQIFIGISSLKMLDLSYNQLNFECEVISHFKDGEKVIQNFNLLDSPLHRLDKLQTLNLSHNNLTAICDDFLVIMAQMQNLDLSHNKIPALTWEQINFLSSGTIDLRYNQITSIQPSMLQKPDCTLLLGHNPFNCDCKNFKMLKELKNLKYSLSDASCSEPKSLQGIPLISIAEARNSISLDNLTCGLPDAPKNCDCISRPSRNMIECVCDAVVTNLPDPNKIKDYNFTDQEITTKYGMLLKLKAIDKLETLPNFVTNLSLSNLALEDVPNIPDHITYVDLTYNKLESIPEELLSRNLTFNLSNNNFKCTCAGQTDIANLKKYKDKIYDYLSLLCHEGDLVENISVPQLCDVVTSTKIAVSISMIGLLIAVLVILIYKYNLEIKIWLYNQGWTFGLFNYENALDSSKKYDIFLSYCHEDEDYVIQKLLPFMEAKYEVCVHTKHFIPGEDIMTQIYRAVADSKRTVIVASQAYFKSPWCLEEMRAAYKQTEVDQRTRAVVILRTDVDPKSKDISDTMRSYLNLNTWIGENDPRFWHRLCYFLPRDVTVEDLRVTRVTNEAKKNLSGQLNKVFVHDGKLGIDNETGEVKSNLARNLCGVNKGDDKNGLKDEVQLAIDNLPGGLDAVCNNGVLAKNLPETLNVVNEDGKLVNVAVVKNGRD